MERRELKFRAWDKIENEMLHVSALYLEKGVSTFGIGFLDEHNDFHRIEDIVLEQFTGLHDSTKWEDLTEQERTEWTRNGNFPSQWAGREIYEGDILNEKHDKRAPGGGHICGTAGFHPENALLVEWSKEKAKFTVDCGARGLAKELSWKRQWGGLEVIGNIHQNPELFKGDTHGA